MHYPAQIDVVWLASDRAGRVAAMITAGEGPIPADVLAVSDCVGIEDALLALPVVGQARLMAQVPNPASFVELSRRGLFVYDWTDVHRAESAARRVYELMCVPVVFLGPGDLPHELRDLAFEVEDVFGSTFVSSNFTGLK